MRLRRLLRSAPWGRLAVGVALTAATAVSALAAHRDAAATLARYGPTRAVVVARRDLAAGTVVTPGDVELRDEPVALQPPGALGALPPDAVVTSLVLAGEALTDRRLAPAGLSPTAALVPAGAVGLAVPLPLAAPPLAPGDRVDLIATAADGTGGTAGGAGTVMARAVTIVAVTDGAVTVAVPEEVAPRLAGAMSAGALVVGLSASSSPR